MSQPHWTREFGSGPVRRRWIVEERDHGFNVFVDGAPEVRRIACGLNFDECLGALAISLLGDRPMPYASTVEAERADIATREAACVSCGAVECWCDEEYPF